MITFISSSIVDSFVTQAVVMEEYQEPLEIQDVNRPEPESHGVVAEVNGCGVCPSDWHAWQGDWDWFDFRPDPPHILGHEPCGTITEVGEDVEGDTVAIPFNFACGHCSLCRNGRENICENLVGLGFMNEASGAFAEDVVIHGLGGIGLSAIHIGDVLGTNMIGVDLQDEKLDRAEELGAIATVNASDVSDPAGEVRDITNGGADASADALGIAMTCQNAVNSLGKGGRHVQIGLSTAEEQGQIALPTDAFITKEIGFHGSLGLQPSRYPEMLDMIRTGKIDPTELASETIDIHKVPDRLEAMTEFNTMGIPVCNDFSS